MISSRENVLYKRTTKLLRRKYRDETGLYLLEGKKPLTDALGTGIAIEKIFVCDGTDPDLPEEIVSGQDVTGLTRDLFEALSDTRHSQGVIAVARQRTLSGEEFCRQASGRHIVVLDRLQDPGNAGTIIRTAEAAGYAGILALKGTTDIYAPKVVRAAAGSLFRVPVMTGVTEDEAIGMMEKGGWLLVTACADAEEDCFCTAPGGPAALVIGNEGRGVSEGLNGRADLRVRIPMEGEIESLNAAVAAGILMYAMR